jgi:hypothetical protein
MKWTLSACLLAAAVCLAPAARGAVLFERSIMVDRSVNIFTTSLFDIQLALGDSFFAGPLGYPATLFEGMSITPASVGNIYEATPAHPGFQQVADRLTDGEDDFILFILQEAATQRQEKRGWQESKFFLGHGSTLDPDLAGATIEAVKLRIDSFTLTSGSPAALALAPATPPVQVMMTFTVMGTQNIPEPSTFVLGAAGLAMLVRSVYTGGGHRRRAQA